MSVTKIMLGGIALETESGPESQSSARLGGSSVVRMSDGKGVKMTHWSKASGSVSGSGLLPAGLDCLDYGAALELRLTKPRSQIQVGRIFNLDADCRPDRAPWACALVSGRWQPASCERAGRLVTVADVAGAERYMVLWMPMYQVFVDEPTANMESRHGWSFDWEQI